MSAVCPNGHTSTADDYCDTCGSPIEAAAAPSTSSLDLDPAPSSVASATPGTPATLSCPHCQTENTPGALFCEACGYDFTTGAMPRDPSVPSGGPGEQQGGEQGGAHSAGGPGTTAAADPTAADPTAGEPDAAGGPSSTAAPGTAGTSTGEPSAAASDFEWLAEVWIDPDWYQTQEADDPCPSPGLPAIMPLRHRSVLLGRVSSSKNTNPEIDLSSDPGVSRRHAQLTSDGTRWFVEDLGSSNGTFVGPAAGPLPAKGISVGPKTELDDDDRLYVGAWTRVVVRRATPGEVEAYA